MDELHASKTVAVKVREKRQELGWSMRELAERSGISEERIESIENGRRRRGMTVDELMILAHALGTIAIVLLPRDADYDTEEERARYSVREEEASKRQNEFRESLKALKRINTWMPAFLEYVLVIEGKLDELGELENIKGTDELVRLIQGDS